MRRSKRIPRLVKEHISALRIGGANAEKLSASVCLAISKTYIAIGDYRAEGGDHIFRVSVVADFFGFSGISAASARIANILFFIALAIFFVLLVLSFAVVV
jgi:uncharacterized membrane protein YtjA (UPF0391 family)